MPWKRVGAPLPYFFEWFEYYYSDVPRSSGFMYFYFWCEPQIVNLVENRFNRNLLEREICGTGRSAPIVIN